MISFICEHQVISGSPENSHDVFVEQGTEGLEKKAEELNEALL